MAKVVSRRRPSSADPSPFLDAAIAEIAKIIEREGAILKSELPNHGVPRKLAAQATKLLEASGLEVAGKFIRLPLAKQLETQLDGARMLPIRGLDGYVQGASKRDAVAAAHDLVAADRARLLVRSTELLLASPRAPGIDDATLARLETTTTTLLAALKLARKNGASLLRSDVEDALRRILPAAPAPPLTPATPATPAPKPKPPNDLHASIDANREPSGLTWVPKLVRALGGVPVRDEVHAELLRGARAGKLELRPESGMGRLSAEDAALCLAGPQGSRLSWVRRIEERS